MNGCGESLSQKRASLSAAAGKQAHMNIYIVILNKKHRTVDDGSDNV